MPILASEIKFYLTGGATNTDPNASLGGVISSSEIPSGELNNIFDDVTGDESAVGDTEYRCIAVKNTNVSLTLKASKIWILSNTTSPNDEVEIGVETPVGDAVQTVANEGTSPTGITFAKPTDKANGFDLTGEGNNVGEIGPGKWVAIWIKRVVQAGAAAKDNNTFELQVEGDSNE
jgi:hypothetical protein